jgi:hypothetical protein
MLPSQILQIEHMQPILIILEQFIILKKKKNDLFRHALIKRKEKKSKGTKKERKENGHTYLYKLDRTKKVAKWESDVK